MTWEDGEWVGGDKEGREARQYLVVCYRERVCKQDVVQTEARVEYAD